MRDKPWGRLLNLTGSLQNPIAARGFDLTNDYYSIGRSSECSFVVESSSCSKRHCVISVKDGYVFLEDTSQNGTIVNGKIVKNRRIILESRDEIEIKWDSFFVFYSANELHGYNEQVLLKRYFVFSHQQLGSGSFATVQLAADIKTGEKLACKIIKKSLLNANAFTNSTSTSLNIEQEISILKAIIHPNVVSIKDVDESTSKIYLFLARVSGGELFDYILKNNGIVEPEAKFLFFQMLKAIQYLHGENITHRDLKPENLLLESPEPFTRLIVTDFGMAKMLDTPISRMNTRCGTLFYAAPEILDGTSQSGYSQKVDCWSLGVILYTMLSAVLPFYDEDQYKMGKRIRNGEFTFDERAGWSNVSTEAKDLIKKLLVVDPQKRLSVEEMFSHPWIKSQRDVLDTIYAKVLKKCRWEPETPRKDRGEALKETVAKPTEKEGKYKEKVCNPAKLKGKNDTLPLKLVEFKFPAPKKRRKSNYE